jgi:hypothetical protein
VEKREDEKDTQTEPRKKQIEKDKRRKKKLEKHDRPSMRGVKP